MNIKKGDKVIILKGKDKGKTGKVEKTYPSRDCLIVAGLNVFKKHLKKNQKNPYGGIVDVNMPIKRSNVAVICPRCEKSTRITYQITAKNKYRLCKKCHETIDDKK